jgi:hypothetical protein
VSKCSGMDERASRKVAAEGGDGCRGWLSTKGEEENGGGGARGHEGEMGGGWWCGAWRGEGGESSDRQVMQPAVLGGMCGTCAAQEQGSWAPSEWASLGDGGAS